MIYWVDLISVKGAPLDGNGPIVTIATPLNNGNIKGAIRAIAIDAAGTLYIGEFQKNCDTACTDWIWTVNPDPSGTRDPVLLYSGESGWIPGLALGDNACHTPIN